MKEHRLYAGAGEEARMELLHRRCAGLDVHKEEVVAGVRVVEGGKREEVTERFGTTTAELLRLGDCWRGGG